MNNKLIVPVVIIVAGILIAGTIFFVNSSSNKLEGALTSQMATDKVISFLNDNVLQNGQIAKPVETSEENGVYKVKFSVDGEEVEWMVSRDGSLVFPQAINIEEFVAAQAGGEEQQQGDLTLGNFSKTNNEVCSENGKPIVYFFGSTSCPHCQWEHPIMQEVAARFNNYISFHDNMDSQNDAEIFSQYSKNGYVPATLIGCKYFRVGSGETQGEETEKTNLTALICDLTGGQPGEICSGVQESINNI